jgi:uncharacterized membrane protein
MKIIRLLSIAALALLPLSSFVIQALQPAVVAAADQAEQVTLTTRLPALSGNNQLYYTFNVDLQYSGGKESRYFDLSTSGPKRFIYNLSQSGQSSTITSIKLDPNSRYPETIQLAVQQNPMDPATPGDYTIKLEASSGDIKGSVDLNIRILPLYFVRVKTLDGMSGYQIDPNKETPIKLQLLNNGDSPLQNINLTYSIKGNPAGWEVKFDPSTVDLIAAQNAKELTMSVKPPEKAEAGDYEVLVTARTQAATASDMTTIRFTVKSSMLPQVLIWVVAVIIAGGLLVVLLFFGKRSK